ncbi:branched-chain amino acid ABC transporter permease [Cupriavidus consociatus]|uniref:branched-chain amino acid ABC transporter permease n=1 Tax=Cupriavidus consociatus TaxID=2821357 RepID=UPI001AE5CC82|nr:MULTISPECIES: branched-chain amino acid ABC transporter permease [unclassified Cupriavidus]MBP0620817.1 branched-chain amino acid ABC transporter permease [Cupriavidus sp. LEh25]MDK2657477.1 branched-chain amino acid ABC transporter permease [Cupriavidus sp. LEh21]
MDITTAALLAQDGITSGAVYGLLALALVLVFSVTRVIFLPQGEFVAYGALTLAAMQAGHAPQTSWLLLGLGVLTFAFDTWLVLRSGEGHPAAARRIGVLALKYLLFPVAVHLCVQSFASAQTPMLLQVALTMLVVVPMGPMLYRVAYQPLAESSVLVLLIVSVGVHFALGGLGLVMFGAEGSRTTAFSEAFFELGGLNVSGQSLWVVGVAVALIVGLFGYFERTISGKALRATAVNRLGARLVGIGTVQAGRLSFTLAAAIGALCGVLIAPLTTVYYESGFLIGLKGFVGAIVGGLVSYPLAAAGALLVGLLESYSSFWASAYKEVIVFTLIIPVLLWRSMVSKPAEEE